MCTPTPAQNLGLDLLTSAVGDPNLVPPRAVQTQIYVGVLGVRQQTGYLDLGSLARPGEPIRGLPDKKKTLPETLELIVLAKSNIFRVSDSSHLLSSVETFVYSSLDIKKNDSATHPH